LIWAVGHRQSVYILTMQYIYLINMYIYIYTDNADERWTGGLGGGGKGKAEEYHGQKGKGKNSGVIFEIHCDLTYRCARTHERNETISRLD